jgi:hypothetical protein
VQVQHTGLVPFPVARATYDATGRAVSFRLVGGSAPIRTAHITFIVYTGTALISLNGDVAGPFIELEVKGAFDFPIETESVFIKGKGAATEVCVVAALNPVESNPRR